MVLAIVDKHCQFLPVLPNKGQDLATRGHERHQTRMKRQSVY